MAFLVISSSLFAYVLLLLLFHRPRRMYSAKDRRLRLIAEIDKLFVDELSLNFSERFIKPYLNRVKRALERAATRNKRGKAQNEKLDKQLRMAGIYMSASAFGAVRAVVAVCMLFLVALLVLRVQMQPILKLLILFAALFLALLAPMYYLILRARMRQRSIRYQLPDMMDVLTVSIDAGLSFDIALKRALDKFIGALKEEMTVTSMEIQMGKPRRIALTELGERNNIAELKSLASAVMQSEQMGTPIKNVLKTQAAQLRADRKQVAQEKGMKASVKMLLPMVAFVFPVIFIILMGPTVLNLIKTFG